MEHLPNLDIEQAFGVEFGDSENRNVYCPHCEDPDTSKTPSCSVSKIGLYFCNSCPGKGTFLDFYMAVHKIDSDEAVLQLTGGEIKPYKPAPVPPEKRLDQSIADRCAAMLMKQDRMRQYLKKDRGLLFKTVNRFIIGMDESRITIPIYNEDGVLINIRRYLPNAPTDTPKMLSHPKGDGSPHLYPVEMLSDLSPGDELILCEGEWDAMLLNQFGFNGLTKTAGVTTWKDEWTQQLAQYSIVIIFDVHDKENQQGVSNLGQRMAWEIAAKFHALGSAVKVVELPLPKSYIGGDITDYFIKENNKPIDLKTLIDKTSKYDPKCKDAKDAENRIETAKENLPLLTLIEAADAKYNYQNIRMRCLVAGKGTAPYILPKRVKVTTTEGITTTESILEFKASQGHFLSLLNVTKAAQKGYMRAVMNISKKAKVVFKVMESFNVEEVYLIPSVDEDSEHGQYAMRQAYYVGHSIKTNQTYEFEGFTLPDPANQRATHVLTSATLTETNIDTFALTDDIFKELKETFQPSKEQDIHDKLEEIAEHHAQHVTRIYGRPDLHSAVDLVFHSPLSFSFNGTRLRKGWLDALILGDTRTGKGFVAEGLLKYYRLGEILSAESLSMAGLIGAIQKIGERWALVWGKLPLNDRKLVILDECTALDPSEIGKLSRIRSEGIAEITKVISEKTFARVRQLWLANARPSTRGRAKMLSSYNYGIEAGMDVIGAPEDMARFDFALVVAQNEVDSTLINKAHKLTVPNKYTRKLCQQLLKWGWSRTHDQIKFTAAAEKTALQAAQVLGEQFSAEIPLIQSEDVRFKLARIAAAAAVRTFSTKDGINLVVTKEHIQYAYNFLCHIYKKPSCGYAQLSQEVREKATLRNLDKVREELNCAGEFLSDLVSGLIDHQTITANDLCDFAGVDFYQAKSIISALVRHQALKRENNYYVKKPAFKTYLQNLKAELGQDEYLTEEDK